ncbi:MAG: hypothetical protein U0939_01060 [Pirellulales bacterium]
MSFGTKEKKKAPTNNGPEEFLRGLQQVVNVPGGSSDDEDDAIERRARESQEAVARIAEVIEEHDSRRKQEQAAFLGLDNMEDVFKAVDERVRKERCAPSDYYQPMLEVYKAVEARRIELFEQLDRVFPAALLDKETKVYEQGRALATTIRGVGGPLPSDFESQRDKLSMRLNTLAAPPEEKNRIRDEVLREGNEKKGKEQEDFKRLLEKSGTRSLERMDSFDPFITAADPDDAKLLFKQFEAARERYLKILDTGGTTAEAEQQLSHIPKCWWPPAFVKEVQAWRAIERQRRDAVVKELFKEAQKDKKKEEGEEGEEESTVMKIDGAIGKLTTVTGAIAGGKDQFSYIGIGSEDAEKIAAVLGKITMALEGLRSAAPGVDFAMEFSEFQERNTAEKVEKVAEAVAEFGERVENALSAAENISEAAKEFAEKFIGPVVIASGIAKFVQGCAKMKNIADSMKNTANLIDRAEIEMVLGDREDGGALVRSMENSRTDQKVKLAKVAIETVDATLQIAEGSVDTAGQTTAKYGIMAVRKVITLGAAVAFADVNFRRARQAMHTLNDARAGSMVAQVQIFEDSTYYAMSYISYLVEQGDPIADSFARRSVTDADVKQKDYSTSVLAELMQKAAGKFDVDQGSETRTEAIGKQIKSGVDAVKEKWDAFTDKYFPSELPGSSGVEYDPGWKHAPSDVVLAEGYWMAARRRAVDEAGLFDYDEKLPAGFLAATEAFQSLGLTDAGKFTAAGLADAAKGAAATSPLRKKELLLKAHANLAKCSTAIQNYDAWHTPAGKDQKTGPHAGFVAYQVELTHEVNRCLSFLDSKLDEPGWLAEGDKPRDFGWKPPKSVSLTSTDFQRYWDEASKQAWLTDDPPGPIVSALNEVSGAALAVTGREKPTSSDSRDVNKHYFDSLIALTREIDKAWSACQHPGLKEYLLALKLEAAKKARGLDQALNDFPSFTVKNAAFSAAAWRETYEDARDRGAADKVDGEAKALTVSLEAWGKAEAKMLSQKIADQILGRTDGLTALKDVNKNAVAVGLKIGSPPMSEHCTRLAQQAKEKLQQLDGENNQATFAWNASILEQPEVWNSTYQAAVEAGCVVETKSLREAVKKALGEVAKAKSKLFDGELAPKERRTAAAELVKAIEHTDGALRALQDDKGHRNQNFQKMLAALVLRVQNERQSTMLVNTLSGARSGPYKPPLPRDLNRLNWDGSGGAQQLAVEAGILENDKDDSFGRAISDAYTQVNLFRGQSRAMGVTPKELIETKRECRSTLEKLKKAAAAQKKAIDNEDYGAYMQKWIELAEQLLTQLSENESYKDVGEFNPPTFVYREEHWQEVKKQAVGMGLLEDVRTNVGKFLTASTEKYDAFVKLRDQPSGVDPQTLESARQEAIAKIRQTMGAVSQVRKMSQKNDKWERYLDQATRAIQSRYDACVRRTSNFDAFDVKLPREPTLLDWQRAQEQAVTAGLLKDAGDATFGRAISDSDTKTNLFLSMSHAIGITAESAREARDAALESLTTLRNAAGVEKRKSPDGGFQKYLDEWADYAARRSELVNKRYSANFE